MLGKRPLLSTRTEKNISARAQQHGDNPARQADPSSGAVHNITTTSALLAPHDDLELHQLELICILKDRELHIRVPRRGSQFFRYVDMSPQDLKQRRRKDYGYLMDYRTRWSDNDM